MKRRWVTIKELAEEIAEDMGSQAAYAPSPSDPAGILKGNKAKSTKEAVSTSYCQWSVLPNDAFLPSGPKIHTLDAGVYNVVPSDNGPVFVRAKLITDDLVTLED